MTQLPESPYCRVRARVATIWADGIDAGTSPDWSPAVGEKVTLTPSIGAQLLVYDVAGPEPIIVTVERVQCEVDADGWLASDGRPVFIAPTDDPLLSATGWTWTATIKGETIPFSAPAGGVVDLALFVATPAVDSTEYVSVVQIVADYITANPPDVEQAVADWLTANPPTAVADHGTLTGLADDDHPQYHTDARGDARYSPLGHGHTIADVSGLQSALDGKQPAGSYAPATHNHDDRYYTEAETDTLLSGKAATGHTHGELHTHANAAALALVSGTNTGDQDLSGYATTGHNHDGTYATALGPDDNYVTDAEKVKLGNLSGTNTGDQTLPTWSTIAGKPAVIGAGATAAAARAAIGAGTSDLTLGTTGTEAAQGNHLHDSRYVRTVNGTSPDGNGNVAVSGGGGAAPDATTAAKGIVRLAGDLGGTADAPTVPGLAGKAAASHTHAPSDVTGTAVITTDPRLSDARTPTAHTHDDRYYTESEVDAALTGKASSTHNHDGVYAPALGADDNYVTGTEKAALHSHANKTALDAVSGTNTGDQDLSGLATTTALTNGLAGKADTSHTHTAAQVSDATTTGRSVLTAANAAAARTAIGAGTSNLAIGTTGTTAAAGNRAATEAAIGMVELATTAEATTGTDTTRAVTPAGVKAVADAKAPVSHTHAYADLTGKPTLGTAAATASTDYATAAQGAKADTALQPTTPQPINAQTGTTYTLVAADAGKLVTLTNATAITLTVPSGVFTAGQRVDVFDLGVGRVTFVAGAGMTLSGTPSLVSRAQYSAHSIVFLSAAQAVVVGDLA